MSPSHAAALRALLVLALAGRAEPAPEVVSDGANLVVTAEDDVIFSIPGQQPPLGARQLDRGVRAAVEHVRRSTSESVALRADLTAQVDAARSAVDGSFATMAEVAGCAALGQVRGAGGRCIARHPGCAGIGGGTAGLNITVTYGPPELARELLPGTLATFSCDGAGQQLYASDRAPALCQPHVGWNRTTPVRCQPCGDVTDFCTECSADVCALCGSNRSLLVDAESGELRCTKPRGRTKASAATDCDELNRNYQPSGASWLMGSANESEAVRVFCDQGTAGGGWTLLTQLREPLPEGGSGLPAQHATDIGTMWIKGCGTEGTIGCDDRGPTDVGWDAGVAAGNAQFSDAAACAVEGQACDCTGTVFYGVPGYPEEAWNRREVNGVISCSNGVFGDPRPGVGKQCRCSRSRGVSLTRTDALFRSVDWRVFLEPGERYELRQTIGVGRQTATQQLIPLAGGNDGGATQLQACVGECDADSQCAGQLRCFQRSLGELIPGCSGAGGGRDWDYCYDVVDAGQGGSVLDVSYSFTYPGFVLQDDADGDEPANLTWALADLRIIRDTTQIEWDLSRGDDGWLFYPPWSNSKPGHVVSGCSSYSYSARFEGCARTHAGSAGITKANGTPDPPGSALFPHVPANELVCAIYGPSQGGLADWGNWCDAQNVQGAYWIRRARQ